MIFKVQRQNGAINRGKTTCLIYSRQCSRIQVENKGNTVSRSALIDYIWTDGAEYVDENALSVSMKRLRDKLSAHRYIKTIYGIGYMWQNLELEQEGVLH